MIREIRYSALNGLQFLVGGVIMNLLALISFVIGASIGNGLVIFIAVLLTLGGTFILLGLFMVNPNEGRILQFFGDYVGTVHEPGLRFANPFFVKHRVSLRVRNFESDRLKVNDHAGNPIEIATVVVWKVVDTAEALFHVDNYEHFVRVQSESALRNLATHYPYDS
jgi:regulator of protease activity HflC (stomatin/prohibitin superfamily)